MIDAGQNSYVSADTGTGIFAVGATESVGSFGDVSIFVVDQGVTGPAAVSATGDVTTYFYSSGPARAGDITITNTTANKGGMARLDSNASVIVTDGIHTYTFGIVCDSQVSCGTPPTATFAFNLGSSFSVEQTFSVYDSVASTAYGPMIYDDTGASIAFTLSDTNGNPVTTNIVPEPSTLALSSVSLPLFVWMLKHKSPNPSRPVIEAAVTQAA